MRFKIIRSYNYVLNNTIFTRIYYTLHDVTKSCTDVCNNREPFTYGLLKGMTKFFRRISNSNGR